MKGRNKIKPQEELSEVEIGNLSKKVFSVMIKNLIIFVMIK